MQLKRRGQIFDVVHVPASTQVTASEICGAVGSVRVGVATRSNCQGGVDGCKFFYRNNLFLNDHLSKRSRSERQQDQNQ